MTDLLVTFRFYFSILMLKEKNKKTENCKVLKIYLHKIHTYILSLDCVYCSVVNPDTDP
jgi:hypothetical protein